ncbi:MAG TPA: amidase, partial [Terriglobales bacterium]
MSHSRRQFVTQSLMALLASTVASQLEGQQAPAPGTPPAFGTAPPVGPEVSASTFSEAEKLVRIELNEHERSEAAENWRQSMAAVYERRTGPRTLEIPDDVPPYSYWNPVLPGESAGPTQDRFVRSTQDAGALPQNAPDIAYAPVWRLSQWLQKRQITSEKLTQIYLDRIQQFDPKLRCIITLTPDLALKQARQADAEISSGHYRGPLHGIPFGVKDLLDTAGIKTTYGAEPFRDRVPDKNSAVVDRLQKAGAVLLAKLSLGALALNDVWFGGQTLNPWNLDEGSSGSSAGPGAATAAGLVGFSIGSETEGSIAGPSMRCGVTGLRPTFGRVPRSGAMTLSWSMDKLGPMARSVEDTMFVLQAISGPDRGDVSSVPSHLDY